MAIEQGITYTITGPDGSRVVFGANDAARLDPDHIGFLDPDDGIVGLIDGGEQRGGGGNRPGQDGGYDLPTLAARRTGVINGNLSAYERVLLVQQGSKLSRATRTTDGDAILSWTPTGAPGARMVRFRRRSAPTYKGRPRKGFTFAVETRDAYSVSVTEQNLLITPAAAPGELGIADPITDPITSPLTSLVASSVVNNGDAPTWPRYRIDGPVVNPEIANVTTGERIRLNATLAAGQWVDVIPEYGVILLNGVNRFRFFDTGVSSWFRLRPGANLIRLLAADYSGTPTLTVYWRDAFE